MLSEFLLESPEELRGFPNIMGTLLGDPFGIRNAWAIQIRGYGPAKVCASSSKVWTNHVYIGRHMRTLDFLQAHRSMVLWNRFAVGDVGR